MAIVTSVPATVTFSCMYGSEFFTVLAGRAECIVRVFSHAWTSYAACLNTVC